MSAREAMRDDWTRRIQDWERDVQQETRPHVRHRKQKVLALLRQGIDPYPTMQEAQATPADQALLRDVRLGRC